MPTLHLSLDAASASEHATLAELIGQRGGRIRTIVRWLENALGRELSISVEPYPIAAARAEFALVAERARDVADQCPGFAEQIEKLKKQAGRAKTAEELAVLSRQVTDNARHAVNVLLVQQQLAGRIKPAR